MIYLASVGFALAAWLAIVLLNERWNLLSCDRFANATVKWIAYLWLGVFMVGLAFIVTGSALTPVTSKQLESMSFVALFMMHGILVLFLVGWWVLTGRPLCASSFRSGTSVRPR